MCFWSAHLCCCRPNHSQYFSPLHKNGVNVWIRMVIDENLLFQKSAWDILKGLVMRLRISLNVA